MTINRNATLADLKTALDWAARESWNPGVDDAEAFYAADPEGFFVATDQGEPVAFISVVNHTEAFAFLGLYIVRPSHRGRGIGIRLWNHAVEHAGDRTIGLDGVPEQQDNYVKSGFTHAGSTSRYTGLVPPAVSEHVREANDEDVPGLIMREAEATGVRKNAYLKAWFANTANRRTLVDEGGFCTVRKCRAGAKIGPLVAEDVTTAARLMAHASSIFGSEIVIDLPDSSPHLAEHCRSMGMSPGFQTARMYRGPQPEFSPAIFAVTSLELG